MPTPSAGAVYTELGWWAACPAPFLASGPDLEEEAGSFWRKVGSAGSLRVGGCCPGVAGGRAWAPLLASSRPGGLAAPRRRRRRRAWDHRCHRDPEDDCHADCSCQGHGPTEGPAPGRGHWHSVSKPAQARSNLTSNIAPLNRGVRLRQHPTRVATRCKRRAGSLAASYLRPFGCAGRRGSTSRRRIRAT